MTPGPSAAVRACDWLLRGAAPLVPSDIRRDWLREWRAEIHYRARSQPRRGAARIARDGPRSPISGILLVARTLGAFPHAVWLRWDRWRFDMLLQDLRYAIRTLTRKPGFAIITVLTLALGIGANAAIFSAVRAVLFRPLPFPAPDQIVQIFSTSVRRPDATSGTVSPPDFADWRRDSRSFAEVAAVNAGAYALTGRGAAEQVPGANVTGGFFTVLGVPALYGRTLQPHDDQQGAEDAAVLGFGLWSRRFGSDPTVVGRAVMFEGVSYRIIGVMPRGFAYPLQSEVWVPQKFTERDLATQRGAHYLEVIARVRPEASIEQARQEMRAIALRQASAYPDTNGNGRISVHPMRDALVRNVRPALLLLLGAVGFVMLIVCVNVANLILTRAIGRTREMAIRSALGAGRVRLLRGALVESLVLAAAGGVAGLALAMWGSQSIAALQEGLGIPLLDQTRVDVTVMLFTAAISIGAALLFGTLPAWHASAFGDVSRRIREDNQNTTGDRGRQRLRSVLIALEMALAVVLLIGAGLLLRSFMRMASVELGFDPRGVQTFNISLPQSKYEQPAQRAAFVESLLAEISRQPGVESAGAIFGMPLTNFYYSISMSTLDGRRLNNEEQNQRTLQVRVVTPDYFRALGIRIVQGRSFTAADRQGAPQSIIVNETAARQTWPGESALGREFTLGTRMGQGGANAGGIVVGVARDVHDFGPIVAVRPTVYLPHAQFPMGFMTIGVKGRGELVSLEPLRAIVASLDPDLPMFRVRTMEHIAADAVAQPRVYLVLLSLFAATAVLLAAIGIYGVLMHAVSQRTREIGIRLALGAGRGEVVGMVVRQAVALALAGLTAGMVLAGASSRFIRAMLFGIEPIDLTTYGSVAFGLFLIALLASYVPARRASQVDPVTALRYE